MKLAQGELVTVDAERAEAWALFFKALQDIYPEPREALRGLQDLHRAACTYEQFGEKLLTVYPWPGRVRAMQENEADDEAEKALSEALADWQAKYRLTGPVAFERALWLLASWDLTGEPEKVPMHLTGRLMATPEVKIPLMRPFEPRFDTTKDYLERAKAVALETKRLLSEHSDYRPARDRTQLEAHLEWLVRWQVQCWGWQRIADVYLPSRHKDRKGTVRRGVESAAALLGLPLRVGTRGRPRKQRS